MKKIVIILFLGLVLLNFKCSKNEPQQTLVPPTYVKEFYSKNSDILWASPKGFDLTMDIYTPNSGKESYPVIIMFHGGGWLINNKSVMNDAAVYLASKSEYIVCNVNYRLLRDQNNTVKINEIVEDAFGAVLWIKENISKYKGNTSKIIVTGDSSGGYLAMMVLNQGQNLESDGFAGNTLGFNPSYLPKGKTAEQIAKENGLAVHAAILSYGVFNVYGSALSNLETSNNFFWSLANTKPRGLFGDGINAKNNANLYKQISPTYTIPKASENKLPPMFFSVGSKDDITTPASIESFINKIIESGHTNAEYWIHEGRPHAFLDAGSNTILGSNFTNDAPPALDKMIAFLNKIFY